MPQKSPSYPYLDSTVTVSSTSLLRFHFDDSSWCPYLVDEGVFMEESFLHGGGMDVNVEVPPCGRSHSC
jgi:hypothetical protein